MASWDKKVRKAAAGDLQPGEEVRAGLLLQPTGTMGKAVAQGAGGLLGRALASKLGAGGDEAAELPADSGIAATLPDAAIVLGLTQQRLLVFSHGTLSGKPKDLQTSVALDAVDGVDVEKQKATFRVVLRFADGTGRVYEAPRVGNDPEAFAAAVNDRQAVG